MASHIERRKFLATLGGAAVAWPVAVRAQQTERMRRIVFLHSLAKDDPFIKARIAAFQQRLEALGWTQHDIRIEHLFSAGDLARMQAYAAEVVNSAPDLIVANSTPVLAALKQATHSIPIVFAVLNDPVGQGFVASMARPGGNITGFTFIDFTLIGKWLELLKEIAPSVRRVALMFNPQTAPYYPVYLRELGAAAASSVAAEVSATPVRDEAEIEAAVIAFAREPDGGLIVTPEPFISTHRGVIMALTQRHRLPAIYGNPQFVTEGALISYGPDTVDIYRRSASYVDRILKGDNPADLPVQAPTKYTLAINLKTARVLGLDVPWFLQQRADEVIE
jgi:putative ABC transport system substrate-binding protein